MKIDSVLQMHAFNSMDWKIDETNLFADNKKTGERILMSRFIGAAANGIRHANGLSDGGFMITSQTTRQLTDDDRTELARNAWKNAPQIEKWEGEYENME